MKRKLIVIIFVVGLLLAGCGPAPAADGQDSAAGGPQVWFDAPLPGSVFVPPNPICPIVAHGASPSGIALFELTINGETRSIPSPDKTSTLVTLTEDCGLTAEGEYPLILRVQDNDGNWSGYATTSLVIAGDVRVQVPTATQEVQEPTPTATYEPPPSPQPPTPTVTETLLFSGPVISAGQFYYYATTCGPNNVEFKITLLNPAASSVFLFYRVENLADATMGSWSEGSAMQPQGGNLFAFTLQDNKVPGLIIPDARNRGPFKYRIHYQFAATDSGGNVVGKSDVFADVLLTSCY